MLLLAIPSLAQVIPGTNDGVQVQPSAGSVEVSLDNVGQVVVRITRLAQPTGTPLDQPRLTRVSAEGFPDGWAVGITPESFQLGPGQSGTATLTIATTASAVSVANITILARMAPSGVFVDEQLGVATVQATRLDSVTRSIIEGVTPYAWLVFLGMAALIVVLVTGILAQRRVMLRALCTTNRLRLAPGGRTETTITMENLLRKPETVYVSAFGVPQGWTVKITPGTLELEGREQRSVIVAVTAPSTWDGGRTSLFLKGVSLGNPRRPATIQLEAAGGRESK